MTKKSTTRSEVLNDDIIFFSENCDFCRLNPNGTERCVRCEEDYVLVLNQGFENQVNRCIERESDRLENCLEANQNLTCFKCEYGFYDKNG